MWLTTSAWHPTNSSTSSADDSSLFLTGDGELGYADALPLDVAGITRGEPTCRLPLGLNASALSSRPSSSRVIYLDFDGHSTNDPVSGA